MITRRLLIPVLIASSVTAVAAAQTNPAPAAPTPPAPAAAPPPSGPAAAPESAPPAALPPSSPAPPGAATAVPAVGGKSAASAASAEPPAQPKPRGEPPRYVLPEPRGAGVDSGGTEKRGRDPLGLSVYANLDAIGATDSTFDLFADGNMRLRTGVAASFDLALTEVWTLAPEVGWGYENNEQASLMDNAIYETQLRAHDVFIGASLRYRWLDWLAPYARLHGGVSWVETAIRGSQFREKFQSETASPFVAVGAGMALETAPGRLGGALRLGALIEGGYLLASAVDVNLEPEDEGRIEVRGAALGSVSRSGGYLRAGAFLRF